MAPSKGPPLRGRTVSGRRRRQNPVSCCFCREKKLRCDRQSPCSNCSFRGLSCSNESKSHPRNGPALPDPSNNAAVLERLRRLEEVVLSQQTTLPSDGNGQQPSPMIYSLPASDTLVHNASAKHRKTDYNQTSASEYIYTEAVHNLEDTGLRRDPWLRTDTVQTKVRVATIQHIALLNSDPALRELILQKPTISCTLPSKEEALFLLDLYSHHIEDLQHILHIPTVQEHLENCYADLERGNPVNVSVLVLLLSIFASASILMSHLPGDPSQLFSQSDGSHLSAYWAEIALEIIKDHRNRSPDVIEDIQATILLGTLLVNVEGFSARVHSFFTVIVSRARDLSLHKIDTGGSLTPRSAIDTEIKRRVWWYVVTIDWVLSVTGGPQEGTYIVQPRQMAVNIPRNVDDQDLIYTNPPINHPLSEPTRMSYSIQRIKLGNLCREIADLTPISVCDTSTVDYQQVIALDQRFETFFQELPVFLRNDEQSIRQSEQVVARYPQMRIQRQLLSILANTKRCKMHQPFLIRGSVDTRYTYSRTMSLKSARTLLKEKRRIDPGESNSHPYDRYHLSGHMTYHTFMATIVLVMDLCFNKKPSSDNSNDNMVENDDDETRVTKTEVMEACRSLHQDQSAAGLGIAYLASLMDVLRKYKVKLRPPCTEYIGHSTGMQSNDDVSIVTSLNAPQSPCVLENPTPNMTQVISIPVPLTQTFQPALTARSNNDTASSANPNPNLGSSVNNLSFYDYEAAGTTVPADMHSGLADFDDIWNDYIELGPNLDMPHWDSLFSNLGPGML